MKSSVNPNFLLLSLAIIALFSFSSETCLAQDIQTEQVKFRPGTSSATIEGSISGRETIDYLLNVREGQYMNVSMASANGGVYFNLMEPGEQYAAFHNGSTNGNQYEGTTTKSGDYRIRVYLMRGAQNTTADYRLEMVVDGSGNSGDAKVSGTQYNATGEVPCKQGLGQPTTNCPFGVVRKGNGTADVTITTSDGSTRTIVFEMGKATSYDADQDYGELKASQEGYLYIVESGDERYEIPDAVINGG